jgi:hypothetical protein
MLIPVVATGSGWGRAERAAGTESKVGARGPRPGLGRAGAGGRAGGPRAGARQNHGPRAPQAPDDQDRAPTGRGACSGLPPTTRGAVLCVERPAARALGAAAPPAQPAPRPAGRPGARAPACSQPRGPRGGPWAPSGGPVARPCRASPAVDRAVKYDLRVAWAGSRARHGRCAPPETAARGAAPGGGARRVLVVARSAACCPPRARSAPARGLLRRRRRALLPQWAPAARTTSSG